MVRMGTFGGGFHPSLTLDRATLAHVRSPSYLLWGEHDPYGDATVAQALADGLSDAKLEVRPAAGHLPWLDDVDHAADVIGTHLAA